MSATEVHELLRSHKVETRNLESRLKRAEGESKEAWRLVDKLEERVRAVEAIARREACSDEGRQLCEAAPTERWHALPDRVKQRVTDLRMRRLWGSPADDPNCRDARPGALIGRQGFTTIS